ncbi:MAG TPA: glycosyltransferase family 2 protein [Patescibacteria group bacterium]|jgi:hypothetical protein|nr:glycosyltransferase family 2 protein [Patescibacteria group bacterium]
MDLSVIVVSYNTKELLKRCLRSVFDSKTGFKYEVIVVDNASKDGSVESIKQDFSQVKLIENNANLGFSKANNNAIKQASGRLILLLNSDTEIKDTALDVSIKYMDSHSDVGAVGGKILLPDGRFDKAARRKFPNPKNSFLRLFGLKKFSDYNIETPIDEEVEVDAVEGAYMMVQKSVIDKVGLLDEDFFMYGEDLDWCFRIKKAGFKIMYFPKAEIVHYKYGSAQLVPFKTIRLAHNAMKIFYRKHYAPKNNFLFNALVYSGINLRMSLVLFLNLFRNKKTVH